MKKSVLNAFALVALVVGLASCGGAKTPEQIKAEAQKKFDAEKTSLQAQADADCNGKKEKLITEKLDSIRAAAAPADTTATGQ